MNKVIRPLLIIFIAGALFACSESPKAPSAPAGATPKPAVQKKAEMVKPVLAQEEEQKKPEYQVIGIRDPFQPFMGITPEGIEPGKGPDPLQRLNIAQVYLVGVIVGKQNKALIQDSSGAGYIVSEGTLLGENNGIVTKITKETVAIKQHFKDYMGRVNTREIVLALRKEEGVK